MARSEERAQFLDSLITTAVENYGHGWFEVDEYETGGPVRATIRETGSADPLVEVNRDVMARGIGVITRARLATFGDDGECLANATTGARLYVHPKMRQRIMAATRENEAADLDCIDAMAIMECGLFGEVRYA